MFAQTRSAALGKKHGKPPVCRQTRTQISGMFPASNRSSRSSYLPSSRPESVDLPYRACVLTGKDPVPEDATKAFLLRLTSMKSLECPLLMGSEPMSIQAHPPSEARFRTRLSVTIEDRKRNSFPQPQDPPRTMDPTRGFGPFMTCYSKCMKTKDFPGRLW